MNFNETRKITERGTNMKRTHLIAVLVGIVAMSIFAADASAYYHPGMGVFMSRDPGAGGAMRIGTGGPAVAGGFIPRDQYADGMNLYQYVRGNPVTLVDPLGLQATQPALKPLNVGTVIGHDNNTTKNFFMPLVKHYTGNVTLLTTGDALLKHLEKLTTAKDSEGNDTCACVRTWVHAQHGWGPNSSWGKAADGGFGGGANGWDWTGFYGKVPPKDQADLPGSPDSYGGRDKGGRDLSDLKKAIKDKNIRFCKPCRIYVHSCEVSSIGTFAGELSAVTGCTVYAGRGKVSTAHADGTLGGFKDPWRAEGGWDTWSEGKRQNEEAGPKYITPTVSWE